MRHTPKNISTHSLTRRLTLNGSLFAIMQDISTHSLTRRLTTLIAFCNRYLTFQLTASQGGWLYVNTYRWNSFHFNSQPHKEADRSQQHSTHFPKLFQLTASQGGWQNDSNEYGWVRVFQLTASQGGWRDSINNLSSISIFQLTASQGGWQPDVFADIDGTAFQLTASQGGWQSSI